MHTIHAKNVYIYSSPEYPSDHLQNDQFNTLPSPLMVKISNSIEEMAFGVIKLLILLSTSLLVIWIILLSDIIASDQ